MFEYSVGAIGGTNGLILMVLFNFLPYWFGAGVYDIRMKDYLTFLPSVMTAEYTLSDYMVFFIAY